MELIGEIGEDEKEKFLGNALALLFPIDWPEPFGLVTIEAMAYGTPVIAYKRGAVPEIIEDGKTGFIVDNQDDAVAAVDRLALIDRVLCRREFERRFTALRMNADYIRIYEELCSGVLPSTAGHVNSIPGARKEGVLNLYSGDDGIVTRVLRRHQPSEGRNSSYIPALWRERAQPNVVDDQQTKRHYRPHRSREIDFRIQAESGRFA